MKYADWKLDGQSRAGAHDPDRVIDVEITLEAYQVLRATGAPSVDDLIEHLPDNMVRLKLNVKLHQIMLAATRRGETISDTLIRKCRQEYR